MRATLRTLSALMTSALLLLGSGAAQAALRVFACEPEWTALVRELAADKAVVTTATTARQDPHRIEARPSLVAAMRSADLVVCTGAELEIGWLPILLRQAGNPRVQIGQRGHFEAAAFVPLLEVPTRVDRSEGDVHPDGNPHIQMDPRNIPKIAEALTARLAALDPQEAAFYAARHAEFRRRWEKALQGWENRAGPLRGLPVVVHHKAFAYLENWLGLKQVAALEPKPGVEPSAAHLGTLQARLRQEPARLILRTPYDDARGSEWLAARTGLPAVVLPSTVGGSPRAVDLFALYEDTLDRLLEAVR